MQIPSSNKPSRSGRGGRLNKPAEKYGIGAQYKYRKTEEGRLVKLKRVRRKKRVAQPTALENPKTDTSTGDRAATTSELNKPAPVQGKRPAFWSKKPRRRTITPGISGLIKKANPGGPPKKNPQSFVDITL